MKTYSRRKKRSYGNVMNSFTAMPKTSRIYNYR